MYKSLLFANLLLLFGVQKIYKTEAASIKNHAPKHKVCGLHLPFLLFLLEKRASTYNYKTIHCRSWSEKAHQCP